MTRSTSPTPVVNDNPFMKPMEWVSLALLVAVIFLVLAALGVGAVRKAID